MIIIFIFNTYFLKKVMNWHILQVTNHIFEQREPWMNNLLNNWCSKYQTSEYAINVLNKNSKGEILKVKCYKDFINFKYKSLY